MIREIVGRQNRSIRLARKLLKKKHRRERGLLVCEGMDLLRAAVEAGADVREILVRRDLLEGLPAGLLKKATTHDYVDLPVNIGVCDQETLEYASALGGGVDVIFVCEEPVWGLADLLMSRGVTFFLDGVGDPGNVGTVIRGALAFGLTGVICSPGTADPYSPKAMRAGMGAQFTLPVVVEVSSADLNAHFRAAYGRGEPAPEVWVADPHHGEDIRTAAPQTGTVIVLGGERTGPGAMWADARRITIEQARSDSLNVAMAGTIFAYEQSRISSAEHGGQERRGPLLSTARKEEPS